MFLATEYGIEGKQGEMTVAAIYNSHHYLFACGGRQIQLVSRSPNRHCGIPDPEQDKVGGEIQRPLHGVPISPLKTFTYFVEWLVVAQLLESVLGAERTGRLFPLLLLVLPTKLLIAGRTVTWSEFAGAVSRG